MLGAARGIVRAVREGVGAGAGFNGGVGGVGGDGRGGNGGGTLLDARKTHMLVGVSCYPFSQFPLISVYFCVPRSFSLAGRVSNALGRTSE